jgi:hypothetical protein
VSKFCSGVCGFALLALVSCSPKSEGSNESEPKSFKGAFDKGFRTSWRKEFVRSCASSAKKAAPTAPINFDTLCGCVADKLLANKTVTELSVVDDSEANSLFDQCAAEGKLH